MSDCKQNSNSIIEMKLQQQLWMREAFSDAAKCKFVLIEIKLIRRPAICGGNHIDDIQLSSIVLNYVCQWRRSNLEVQLQSLQATPNNLYMVATDPVALTHAITVPSSQLIGALQLPCCCHGDFRGFS
ncbi:hypothetical protein T4B_3952 [Trichinella pseudospiralis]|uniref:Uncharacterized protein n=2 Tax=Trichinella pseudospiralis TaxID=6337 RepID=A0A0V1IQ52_TRIPS|nr:hypothetical protein T4E_669 [Trichinella pseudospiralis]KRY68994.1 hypothetical protein T4A_6925 [Trichinella pseudospiralis]KRY84589.1 hypothetical protein T4D_7920 [Trichinella pseudospiralis]KRZ24939.1 hypothetical protein T4B_3952 [Trichinella pseudospiralis]KRZ37829.1 hypothetical protein T4C_8067 [Trichinella pseudospiralis]